MGAPMSMTAYACGHPIDPADTRKILRPTARCKPCGVVYRRAYATEWARRKRAGIKGPITGHANSKVTHCPQGHPYDESNTRITSAGYRHCKTCAAASVRAQRERDPDFGRRSQAKWREANREKHNERSRQWAKDNPEKANAIGRLKQHRKRAVGVITPREWAGLLAWYGGRCLSCGSEESVTLDHVVPVSRGGLNVIGNAQPLCRSCNSRKGIKTIDFRMTAQV